MRSKRKLLLTAAFTALLGVGTFAGVSLSKDSSKVAVAEAVSGNRYIAGSFNSWNASGLAMTKNSASTAWAVSRTFAVGEEFKVTDGTWDSSWGIGNKSSDTAEASDFGGDGNIKCNKAGTYTIIITSSDSILIHAGNLSYQSGKEGWVLAFNNSGASSFTVAGSIKMDAGTGSNFAQKEGISMNAGAKFQIAYSDGYGFTSSGWKTGSAGSGFTKDGDIFVCTYPGTVDVYGYDDGGYKMSAVYHGAVSTVTLNKQDGTGGSNSVSATCGSAMPSITLPSKSGYSFDGYYAQPNGSGTKYYNSDGSSAHVWDKTSAQTLYANWLHVSGRYLVGDFGECSWGIDGAILMTTSGDNYVATVNLEFGDTIKCAYYNGSALSSYFGYNNTIGSCGAYFCFMNDGNDNLVCYARGTYIFYFTDGHYGESENLKLSIEISGSSRTSEQLAAKLMSYGQPSIPNDNSCESKFSVCKSMYLNNLNATEKSTFQGYSSSSESQFKNAYDRYTAWARALGENPWAEGKASGAIVILGSTSGSIGTTIIIIAISATCLAAVGGYFLFRKKKEN